MTGASIPAGASALRTDCTIRPVTTITGRPASFARLIASTVRGCSAASVQTRVRSKSVATTRTSRGKSSGRSRRSAVRAAARRLHDVGGYVRDLLVAELALERGHPARALGHACHRERERRLRVVGVRAAVAARAGVLQGVAARAARTEEDLLASGWVAVLVLRRNRRLRLGRHGADHGR